MEYITGLSGRDDIVRKVYQSQLENLHVELIQMGGAVRARHLGSGENDAGK